MISSQLLAIQLPNILQGFSRLDISGDLYLQRMVSKCLDVLFLKPLERSSMYSLLSLDEKSKLFSWLSSFARLNTEEKGQSLKHFILTKYLGSLLSRSIESPESSIDVAFLFKALQDTARSYSHTEPGFCHLDQLLGDVLLLTCPLVATIQATAVSTHRDLSSQLLSPRLISHDEFSFIRISHNMLLLLW
jgi:hypothetical protein